MWSRLLAPFLLLLLLLPSWPSMVLADRSCITKLPSASHRAGYWHYRIRHGQRCWVGGFKARSKLSRFRAIHVTQRNRNRARVYRSRPLIDDHDTAIWPPLEPQDNFEARWRGEE